MDSTEGQRPRPRPRPKPKLRAAPSVDDVAFPSTSKTQPIEIADDDEMFMRNRSRSTKVWTDLEKRDKGKTPHADTEDDALITTPTRGKSKRKKERSPWQGKRAIERLLSVDNLDEGDHEIEITATSMRVPQTPQPKRQRTRSRSITPPPKLSEYQVQHARRLINHVLNVPQPPASPTYDDDIDANDEVFSNPELAQLARSVAAERARPQVLVTSPTNERVETIHIAVRWQPHPLNPIGKEVVWFFKMNLDDNFRDLFEATAEEASVLVDDLIIKYNNRRIYASVTPMALQIRSEAALVACDKVTYEYSRTHLATTIDSISLDSDGEPEPDASSDVEAPSTSTHGQEAVDSDAEGATFKLTLRSALVTKGDITLTVRSTTKCGSILKAYLTKAGVADQYPEIFATFKEPPGKQKKKAKDPRICIDGERMDNEAEIGDADLEDGDMVEVVGL